MSAGPHNIGRQQVRPPINGVFPLDTKGKCRQFAQLYLECLKKNEFESSSCRELEKIYLECRKDNDLM